jgi:malonate transporter
MRSCSPFPSGDRPDRQSRYAAQVNFFQLLFPDFSLILSGHLLCRYTALNRAVWQQVDSLVYYFLFPILLFHSIVKRPLDLGATSSLLAAGLCLAACAIALSYSLPHWPLLGRHIARRDHAAAAQVGFRFNSFIALALAERIAGPQGLQMISMLIGVCVPVFNMGAVWPMARHGNTHFLRELVRNPLIIATLSGMVANLLGLGVPGWLEPTVQRIGAGALTLGLMAAGAGMQLGSLRHNKTLTVAVLGCKHLALPLMACGLARGFGLDAQQTTVLMAFSALPTASTCYVLASRMGYNGPYVAGLVTLSTLAGLLSLPFALSVLN